MVAGALHPCILSLRLTSLESPSPVDCARGKEAIEVCYPRVCDSVATQHIEFLQTAQHFEMREPVVRDPAPLKVEPLQAGKGTHVGQAGVCDLLATPQVERLQTLQSMQMYEVVILDPTA
jgi:hypothetical protein